MSDSIEGMSAHGLETGLPAAHGFDAERLERAMALLDRGIDEGAYPGAVGLVARRGVVVAARAVGAAELGRQRRPMALDTIFDLASVTKVVAGVSAVLLLLDAGLWGLDDAVGRVLPAFKRGAKRAITLRHLLTHTSGLPAWRPCYSAARTLDETVGYISTVPLDRAPGTGVCYSDLGMILVRALVRAVAGEDLPALLEREVFGPLGMRETGYRPAPEWRDRIAATEQGNSYEQDTVERMGQRFGGWREHLLVGEVHDGNAFYALDGISSHAGLFSTAGDLARFAQVYLQNGSWNGHAVFSAAVVREATRLQTAGLDDSYGLGWRLMRRRLDYGPVAPGELPPVPFMGDLPSDRACGHTGFTGTSLVIDPAYDLALILLANRVHPDAHRTGIERVRPRWHNAVVAAIVS